MVPISRNVGQLVNIVTGLAKDEAKDKHRFWKVDPAVFQPLKKAGLFERYVRERLKQAGKLAMFTIAFLWPVLVIAVGLMFGGLAFWATFVGSFALIGLLLKKFGYAPVFANWNVSNTKFAGVLVAFLIAMGSYLGLIYLKIWFVPIAVAVLGFAAVFGFRNIKL